MIKEETHWDITLWMRPYHLDPSWWAISADKRNLWSSCGRGSPHCQRWRKGVHDWLSLSIACDNRFPCKSISWLNGLDGWICLLYHQMASFLRKLYWSIMAPHSSTLVIFSKRFSSPAFESSASWSCSPKVDTENIHEGVSLAMDHFWQSPLTTWAECQPCLRTALTIIAGEVTVLFLSMLPLWLMTRGENLKNNLGPHQKKQGFQCKKSRLLSIYAALLLTVKSWGSVRGPCPVVVK